MLPIRSVYLLSYICSGQIIATSHDRFPPNWWFGKVGEILFHLARSFPLKEAYTYTVDGSELLHQLGRSEPYIYIWLVSFSIPQGHPFPQFSPLQENRASARPHFDLRSCRSEKTSGGVPSPFPSSLVSTRGFGQALENL